MREEKAILLYRLKLRWFYEVKTLSQRVQHNPCLSSLAHFVHFTHDKRNVPSFDALDLIQL
jgi:hypothetical protein